MIVFCNFINILFAIQINTLFQIIAYLYTMFLFQSLKPKLFIHTARKVVSILFAFVIKMMYGVDLIYLV